MLYATDDSDDEPSEREPMETEEVGAPAKEEPSIDCPLWPSFRYRHRLLCRGVTLALPRIKMYGEPVTVLIASK